MIKFRDLYADEIDVRVATINEKGCTLLLYKDARCDMNILDETVGPENWQRKHTRDNANCIVSIWCDGKKQWVEKEDTGTESYTEKEKGQASDSFKRACFNWGIGRELYTAPFIWVGADKFNLSNGQNGKLTTYDKFIVSDIEIKDKRIVKLDITNSKTGNVCFHWSKAGSGSSKSQQRAKANPTPLTEESKALLNTEIAAYVKASGTNINAVMKSLGEVTGKTAKEYTEEDTKKALAALSEWNKSLSQGIGA